MNELIKRLENLKSSISNLVSNLNLPQKEQRILELADKMQGPGFWNDNENAQKVSKEYNQLKSFYDFWQKLEKDVVETLALVRASVDSATSPPAPPLARGGGSDVEYLQKQTE